MLLFTALTPSICMIKEAPQNEPIRPTGRAVKALKHRILILDGAMGTMIQRYKLDDAAYRGERFKDHPGELKAITTFCV